MRFYSKTIRTWTTLLAAAAAARKTPALVRGKDIRTVFAMLFNKIAVPYDGAIANDSRSISRSSDAWDRARARMREKVGGKWRWCLVGWWRANGTVDVFVCVTWTELKWTYDTLHNYNIYSRFAYTTTTIYHTHTKRTQSRSHSIKHKSLPTRCVHMKLIFFVCHNIIFFLRNIDHR